jgi:arsenite methyltransferase
MPPGDPNFDETSTGHAMSSASWIDSHYLACKHEYESILLSVGLASGWHVLDAGCGTGGFLPVISEMVGSHGRISAIDVTMEHVEVVQQRASAGQYYCHVDAKIGNITSLPFPAGNFDAVWSANVFQYLEQSQIDEAFAEFARVLKPGGVVAIKDGDITALQIYPISPLLLWRLLDGWARQGDRQAFGLLEALKLSETAAKAGFLHVNRQVTFIQRTSPLRPADRTFIAELLDFFLALAEKVSVSPSDLREWREIADSQSSSYVLNSPNFYFREAAVLITGHNQR